MSWFQRGEAGVAQATKEDETRKKNAEAKRDPIKNRFWLKPGSSAKVTFLDTEFFFFREHQLFLNGSWLNWETCLSDTEECPLCEDGRQYSYVAALTIIDHSKYETKKKEIITNQKKLIIFKSNARNKILKQKERREGNLTGCMFEFSRFTDKECSTGEDYEFIQRVSMDELKTLAPKDVDPNEWIKPYEYEKMFYPKTAAQLRALIGVKPPVGSEDDVPVNVGEKKSSPFDRGEGTEKRSLKDLL